MNNTKYAYVVVDVESDGPYPGDYSMVCFGAVAISPISLEIIGKAYGQTCPISDKYIPESLAISGFSRDHHLMFSKPEESIPKFAEWLESFESRLVMWSDNPAFDFSFINYYLHKYAGRNPMGWSARRIGDLYCGLKMDLRAPWKSKLRKTTHDHNPMNDATGNAEALCAIIKEMKEERAKRKSI